MAAAFSGWCRTKMSNLSSRHLKQICDSFPGGFGSRHLIRDSFRGGFGLRNLKHSFPAISGCSAEKGLGFSKGVDGWFSPRHPKAKAMNSFSTISSRCVGFSTISSRCVGFSGIGIAGKGFCSSTLTSTSNEIEKVSNGMIPFTDFYSQLPDLERQGLLYYRRIIKFVRPVFSFLRLCVKNNEYSANPFKHLWIDCKGNSRIILESPLLKADPEDIKGNIQLVSRVLGQLFKGESLDFKTDSTSSFPDDLPMGIKEYIQDLKSFDTKWSMLSKYLFLDFPLFWDSSFRVMKFLEVAHDYVFYLKLRNDPLYHKLNNILDDYPHNIWSKYQVHTENLEDPVEFFFNCRFRELLKKEEDLRKKQQPGDVSEMKQEPGKTSSPQELFERLFKVDRRWNLIRLMRNYRQHMTELRKEMKTTNPMFQIEGHQSGLKSLKQFDRRFGVVWLSHRVAFELSKEGGWLGILSAVDFYKIIGFRKPDVFWI